MRFNAVHTVLKPQIQCWVAAWALSSCLWEARAAEPDFIYTSKPWLDGMRTTATREVNPPPQVSIWCEFEPYDSVRRHLTALAERKVTLYLHVGPDDLGREDLLALLREADARGVEVFAWLLLPYDQHLYVGEWTIGATRTLALDFAAWANREKLGVRWIIFDCEPAPQIGKVMFEHVRQASPRGLAAYLREQKDAARFARSVRELNALIEELHGQGFKVMGSCNRVILDGLRYGNVTWQDALNIPFSMVNWDRASFISYRYTAPRRYYLAMVRRYSTLGVRFFGDRAGIDVGLIGDNRRIPENLKRLELFGGGDHFLSYLDGIQSTKEMAAVIATAREAGVRYVNLYSLDGALQSGASVDTWLGCATAPVDVQLEVGPTPVGSVKAGLTGFVLNKLFRVFVRQDEAPLPVPGAS
jgi:hypothetical protein